MSLMRLLTVGHSFNASKSAAGRYRGPKGKTLPTFGFENQPEELMPPAPAPAAAPEAVNATPELKPRPEPPAPPPPAGKPRTIWNAPVRLLRGLLGRRPDPFARAKAAGLRRASRVPVKTASRPVQAELRLDNVRVVRNDLSDADLELVARPAEAHQPVLRKLKPAVATVSEGAELGSKAMGWMANRLFEAKTH